MSFKIKFRVYEGNDLFILSEEKRQPLIQDFLYENDYVIIVAKDKIGKTILALQLACNLTSGTPFLNMLEVPKQRRVWYFAVEGHDEDIKRRLVNMTKKINIDKDMFKLICSTGLRLNTNEGVESIKQLIEENQNKLPKVIIIDPLYMAIRGSMRDDNVITEFTHVVKQFGEICDASVIIIHHARRQIRLKDGSLINSGDEEIFGSAFLKASVDHVFYMGKVENTGHKFLKCDTQRSGNIIDSVELRLIEPSPLYFEFAEPSITGLEASVDELLVKYEGGLTVDKIARTLSTSKSSIYNALHRVKNVIKTNTRPVLYSKERKNNVVNHSSSNSNT